MTSCDLLTEVWRLKVSLGLSYEALAVFRSQSVPVSSPVGRAMAPGVPAVLGVTAAVFPVAVPVASVHVGRGRPPPDVSRIVIVSRIVSP